jgi:hypothetical protein
MAKVKASNRLESIGGDVPTNGAVVQIAHNEPYIVEVRIKGVADLIYHRWNCEAITEGAACAKGSKGKKTDNVESYVWRMEEGNEKSNLAIPGAYFRGSVVNAAKFFQDPRSPRKSAQDLVKAGVVVMTPLADMGTSKWDYVDQRRMVIQRAGINRRRPAMKAGWELVFELQVVLPEYIDHDMLHSLVDKAGKLVGLADSRPTYGRFAITGFKVVELD